MKTQIRSIALIGFCLLVLCVMSLPVIFSAAGQVLSPIPGVPDDAVDCDRTGITPDREMEQIMAGTLHVYRYQHVTMLMNCSQNMVMNMTSDTQVRNRIVGLDIETDQPFQLNVHMMTDPPVGIQTVQRTLNTYWGFEPDVTLQLRIQLRLHINGSVLNAELTRQINPEHLRWMYWNQVQNRWETVDSTLDGDGYLVCETDHFSIWTVAEIASTGFFGLSTELMVSMVGIGVVVIAVIVMLMRRR